MSKIFLKKYNIRLYSIYKIFSWDLLFYYSIIYLFLTIEKGLSPSLVLLTEASFQLSKLIFQFPCVVLLDILRFRKSLILANSCTAISILILILANNFSSIIISNLICAIGFNIKQLCESSVLYESIVKHKKRNHLFSKIDSLSSSYYYYLDAISAIFTGFLFTVNSYIPIILCFIFCCISVILSFQFEDVIKDESVKNLSSNRKTKIIKKYFKEFKSILRFILQSKRLKSLLIYSGMFTVVLTLATSLRSILLTEIQCPEEYFGIVFAIIQMIAAISSKNTNYYQKKLRNKTLTFFAFSNTFPLIIIGLCMICDLPIQIIIFAITIWLIIYSISKGPFHTLIKRYLHSFVTPSVNTKIYAIQTIVNSTFTTIFSFVTAYLLDISTPSLTLIGIGIVLVVLFIILLEYMKTHVGLKPEEYPKSELVYVELK